MSALPTWIIRRPLSVTEGTVRFRILYSQGATLTDPTSHVNAARTTTLQPRGRVVLKAILNGPGGYSFLQTGEYKVSLLGGSLGLGDSNTITVRITP
jgi:hypothetical protein